jgi:hypothetical protein
MLEASGRASALWSSSEYRLADIRFCLRRGPFKTLLLEHCMSAFHPEATFVRSAIRPRPRSSGTSRERALLAPRCGRRRGANDPFKSRSSRRKPGPKLNQQIGPDAARTWRLSLGPGFRRDERIGGLRSKAEIALRARREGSAAGSRSGGRGLSGRRPFVCVVYSMVPNLHPAAAAPFVWVRVGSWST